MMRTACARFWLLFGGVIAALLAASPAFAQTIDVDCSQFVGLTHRMAGCIRETIDAGADVFFTDFSPTLAAIIGGTMTLAVIFYGMAVMAGMVEKVGRDSIMLAIKLGIVIAFVGSGALIRDLVTQAMDGGAAAVVSYAPPSGQANAAGGDFSQSTCLQVMISQQGNNAPGLPVITPWLGVDCLIDTVIGLRMDNATGGGGQVYYNNSLSAADQALTRGLLNVLFSSLQTSILGIALGVIGLVFIFGLIMVLIRAFFTYIAGYMGVTFLAIIAPIMIPLVLFPQTKQYFDKWVKLLISFALQPIIILVFIIFSITAMDFAVFSGRYSIMYAIAGAPSQQVGFNLNTWLTNNGVIDPVQKNLALSKGDSLAPIPKDTRDTGGLSYRQLYSQCSQEAIAADATGARRRVCAMQYPVGVETNPINWERLATLRGMGGGAAGSQQITRTIFASVLFTCVLVFVLNGLMAVVPMVAHDLMGDAGQSPDLAGMFGGEGRLGMGEKILGFGGKGG